MPTTAIQRIVTGMNTFQPRRIVVAGGATESPLWLQIHADTLGLPLQITENPMAPALGCAVLAATGAGKYQSIDEGIAAMVRVARTIACLALTLAHTIPKKIRFPNLFHYSAIPLHWPSKPTPVQMPLCPSCDHQPIPISPCPDTITPHALT